MKIFPALIDRRGFVIFCVLAIFLCIAAALLVNRGGQHNLLAAGNMLGPAAESILHSHNLRVCYYVGSDFFTCARSGRMPLAPAAIAVLYSVFRDHMTVAVLVKTVFFFMPVLLAFSIAWQDAKSRGPRARALTMLAFLVTLCLPPTLFIIGNINFEEGFYYGFLSLAICVIIFPRQLRRHPAAYAGLLCTALVLTYLTKSSMIVPGVALVSLLSAWLMVCLRRRKIAVALMASFFVVPIFWGVYQHHAGGRFTTGTSFDNPNFYKGNNSSILQHYPPPVGSSLDPFDKVVFADWKQDDEWIESDIYMARAKVFIEQHPAVILRADLRKFSLFFLSIRMFGGGGPYSPFQERVYTAGMIVFRAMLLCAITISMFRAVARRGDERFSAVAFFVSVCSIAAPYIAGFALTRHAVVLALPAAAYLASTLGKRDAAATGEYLPA